MEQCFVPKANICVRKRINQKQEFSYFIIQHEHSLRRGLQSNAHRTHSIPDVIFVSDAFWVTGNMQCGSPETRHLLSVCVCVCVFSCHRCDGVLQCLADCAISVMYESTRNHMP